MFDDDDIGRRSFVRSAAAVSLGGTALAGCSGGGGSNGNDGGSDGNDGGSDGNGGGSDGNDGGSESFDGWMENVENYDGVADETGASEVTVVVGAEGNGGNYAFEPAAVRVSTGTNVVWEWNGEGGSHNVKAMEGGDFESELTSEAGYTFEHTFEESGTVPYQCDPHVSLGMKGVVDVE